MKMTPEEAINAVTSVNGAYAMDLSDTHALPEVKKAHVY
jgi:imidazolonepropionase-like amidohydrolase